MRSSLACSAGGDFNAVGVFFDFAAIFAKAAVAALAALEVGDSFEQMDAAEVGPVALGDEYLGICLLYTSHAPLRGCSPEGRPH